MASFLISAERLINIVLLNESSNKINIAIGLVSFGAVIFLLIKTVGIIFCLLSIFLFTYVNFFEKSFPSCLAIKNGQPLRGIYNYIRHPSYYIFFFITFGTALLLSSIPLFILACINHICFYFYYIIEENQIKKENPYYNEYLKKTKRFLPRFSKIYT